MAPHGGRLKVIVKSPYSQYSGYGTDGFGLIRALDRWGCDVYPQPTWVDVPIPADLAHLFTKTLVGPFDLLICHWDPEHLEITRGAREMSRVAVAWSMWEFAGSPPGAVQACDAHIKEFPGEMGRPDCPDCKPVRHSGLYPHCSRVEDSYDKEGNSKQDGMASRLRWFDMVLGYDQVSVDALAPYVSPQGHVGVLQGGYDSADWKHIDRDWESGRFQFAQPLDAKVLTPSGWRRMGELAVGDALVNPDGGMQTVERVWERGEQDVFRVTLTDGSQAESSADHLWRVKSHVRDEWEVLPLREIAPRLRDRTAYRWAVPQPVLYMPHSIVPVDPYLLGLLLGDGSLPKRKGDPARFYSADPELVGFCRTYLPAGMELQFIRTVGGCESYDLVMEREIGACCKLAGTSQCSPTGRVTARGLCATHWAAERRGSRLHLWPTVGKNEISEGLRVLGLEKVSTKGKFIPGAYLEASSSQRLAVLQGLMDTDGTAGETGSPQFSTSSPQLAQDVQYLVRSLGGYAYRHEYINNVGNTAYLVSVIMDQCPFRLPRKVEAWEKRTAGLQRRKQRRIASVEPAGRTDMRCITVSGDSGTYVTDDLIVTHNCMHGALNDRKQPWLTIGAFQQLKFEHPEEFAPARLALHTNSPGTLFPELNKPFENTGIRIYVDVWDAPTLREFYAASHCLVAPSRGEGKNLPALEFMTTGGAVIATNFGGHTGWIGGDWAYPLDYTLGSTFGDQPWAAQDAKVDVQHLADTMWHVFTHRSEAKAKGARAEQLIPQMCDWKVVVERLFQRVRDNVPGPGPQIYDAAMACRVEEEEPSRLLL